MPLLLEAKPSQNLASGEQVPVALLDTPSLEIIRVNRTDAESVDITISTEGAKPGKYGIVIFPTDGQQAAARLRDALTVTSLGPLTLNPLGVQDSVLSARANTTTYVRIAGIEDAAALANATVTLGPCAVAGVRPVPGTNDTLEFTVLAGAPPGVYDLRVVSPVQGTAKLDDAVRVVDAEAPKVVSVADPVVSNRANLTTLVALAGLVPNTSAPLEVSLRPAVRLPDGSRAPHGLFADPSLPILKIERIDNDTLEIEAQTAGAQPGKYDLVITSADGKQPAARLPDALTVTSLGPLALNPLGVQDSVLSARANTTTYARVAGVEDAAALANATVTLGPCAVAGVRPVPGTNDTLEFTVLAGALPGVYDLRVVSPVQGTAKLDDAVRVVDAEAPKVVSVADPVVSNRANLTTLVALAGLVPNTSAPLEVSLRPAVRLPDGSRAPHGLFADPSLPILKIERIDNDTLEIQAQTAGAQPGKYDLVITSADGQQPAARLPDALTVTSLGPLALNPLGVQDSVLSTRANSTTYVRVAGIEDAAALANATVTLGPCAVAGVRPVPGTNDTLEFTVLAGAPPGVYDLRVVSPVQGTAKLDDAVRVVNAEVPKVVSVADPVVSNRANISTVGVNVAGLVPNTSAPLVASLTRSPTLPNGSPAPHSLPGPDEPALPVLRVTRLDNGTLELEVETAGAKPGKYDLTVATADGTQPAARLPHAVLVTGLGPLGLAAGGVQDRVVSTQANLTTYVRVAGVEDAAALANATVTLGPCAVAGVRPVPGTNDTLEFTVLAGALPGVYDLRVVSPVQGTAKLDDAVRVVNAEVPKVVSVADPVVSNRANISTVGVNVAGLVPNTSVPLVASLTRSPTLPNGSPAPHSLPGPDEPALPVLRVTRLDNGTLELEVETAGAKPGKYDLTVATADGTQPAARLPHAVLVTGLGPLGLAAGGVQDRVVSTQANLTTYVRVAGIEDAAALANATVTLGPCAVAGVRPVPGTNDTLEFTVLAGAPPGVYDLRVVSPVQGTAKLDDAVRVVDAEVPKVVSVADPVVSNRANISTVGVNVAGLVPNTSAPLVASLTRSPTLPNGSPAPHSLPGPDEPALPVLRVTRLDNGTLELEVETAGAKPGKYDLTVATADGTQPAARLPHAVLVTGLGPLGLAAGGVQDRVVSTQANLTTYVRVAGVEDAAALANATVTLGPCAVAGVRPVPGTNDTLEFMVLAGAPPGVYDLRVVSPVQGTAKLDDAIRVVDAEVPKVVSVADPVVSNRANISTVGVNVAGLVPNTSAPLVASLTRSPTLPNGSPAPHSLPGPDEPALPVLRVTRLDNGTLELEVETAVPIIKAALPPTAAMVRNDTVRLWIELAPSVNASKDTPVALAIGSCELSSARPLRLVAPHVVELEVTVASNCSEGAYDIFATTARQGTGILSGGFSILPPLIVTDTSNSITSAKSDGLIWVGFNYVHPGSAPNITGILRASSNASQACYLGPPRETPNQRNVIEFVVFKGCPANESYDTYLETPYQHYDLVLESALQGAWVSPQAVTLTLLPLPLVENWVKLFVSGQANRTISVTVTAIQKREHRQFNCHAILF
eukprot:tig00021234_g19423.t1